MERCTSCNRAGPDIEACGSHELCPHTRRPVDPAREVVVSCELCDATRVIAVGDLIHHKSKDLEIGCRRTAEGCQAVVVLPAVDALAPTKAVKRSPRV